MCRSMWKKVLIGMAVVALGYGAQAEDGKVDVKDEVCYPQSPIAYCGQQQVYRLEEMMEAKLICKAVEV